jgi:hypothetical protein
VRRARALLAALVLGAALARAQEPPAPEGGEPPKQEGGDPPRPQEEGGEGDDGESGDDAQQSDAPPLPVHDPSAEEPPAPVQSDGSGTPAEAAPTLETTPAPPAPSHPPVTWPLGIDAIGEHLRGLAATYPSVAALESIGRSAGGREILVLRVGARDALPGVERPVLLLADHQGSASAGPEASLELAWQLCAGFERDERVRALLTQATLVIAPALDPDARAPLGAAPRTPVRFEHNFPSGWQPDSVRPGAGRVSLSQPETLAAARYLIGLRGCAMLLGFAPAAPRGEPYPDAELPASDREVFARLVAALELEGKRPVVPWPELGSPGGSLFDFAYQARGIYSLALPLPSEEDLAAGALASFGSDVVARVLRCLSLLPRVELEHEGLERLASDTWQLDVRIQNAGTVPTSSALARHREPLADVTLRLEGAKLVATAKKPESGAAFTDASFQVRPPLSGGTLSGGEGRWLRLILEASSGGEVIVTAASAWAGSDVLRVSLP